MYGQIKYPILSNANHAVIVSGTIDVAADGTTDVDIPGVESVVVHATDGTGVISFRGGIVKVQSVIMQVMSSTGDADKVNIGAVDGEINFSIIEATGGTEATEACKISLIAIVTTA